jgi:hypothetical protein
MTVNVFLDSAAATSTSDAVPLLVDNGLRTGIYWHPTMVQVTANGSLKPILAHSSDMPLALYLSNPNAKTVHGRLTTSL